MPPTPDDVLQRPASLSSGAERPAPGYVALLRGINVGGRNLIRMSDLAECFKAQGFADVATYIQSGNVLFRAGHEKREELVADIEQMLSSAFDYQACVALRVGG